VFTGERKATPSEFTAIAKVLGIQEEAPHDNAHTTSDDPICKALAAAKEKKGWDYKTIAEKLGEPEDRVTKVFTGERKATPAEFDAIAKVLDIKPEAAPHDRAHTTTG